MQKRWRMAILISLAVVGFIGYRAARHHIDITDGFGPSAIATTLSHDEAYKIGHQTDEQRREVAALLGQRFAYIGKGTQSYVLESEDHRYVIKFFKGKHLGFYSFLKRLFPVPVLGKKLQDTFRRREDKRAKIFAGCKLAYDKMAHDTGVVFIHLTSTGDLPKSLVIVDKLGNEHTIDLNKVPFYVQKKGASVYAAFKEFESTHNPSAARASLHALFEYLVARSKMGILDRDPNYINNLGFLDGSPATLDVGNITEDALIRNPREYGRRIIDNTQAIRNWLTIHFPELVGEYDSLTASLEIG